MFLMTLFILPMLGEALKLNQIKTIDMGIHVPEPDCEMLTRKENGIGAIVKHVTHYDSLYFQLRCPQPGGETTHCLVIANCTIASGSQNVPIIDANGCSLHPSIFKDVEYEGDLIGGFRNPYPVLLNGASNFVRPKCMLKLRAKQENSCNAIRPGCVLPKK